MHASMPVHWTYDTSSPHPLPPLKKQTAPRNLLERSLCGSVGSRFLFPVGFARGRHVSSFRTLQRIAKDFVRRGCHWLFLSFGFVKENAYQEPINAGTIVRWSWHNRSIVLNHSIKHTPAAATASCGQRDGNPISPNIPSPWATKQSRHPLLQSVSFLPRTRNSPTNIFLQSPRHSTLPPPKTGGSGRNRTSDSSISNLPQRPSGVQSDNPRRTWPFLISWRNSKLRGKDLNLRPPGYEPDELPGCSTPRLENCSPEHGTAVLFPQRISRQLQRHATGHLSL